jgi:hypothetical protein
MFDKLTQTDDIFAQTDQAAPQPTPPTSAPEMVQPTQSSTATASASVKGESAFDREAVDYQPPSSQPSSIVEERMAELTAQKSSGGGIKTAVIILAIVVVIGAAFLISWRILSSRTPVTPAAPADEVQEAEDIEQLEEKIVAPEPEPELVVEVDADQDGLTDARETELGTNALSSDTDGDGLFDREEVDVYLTDPLKTDTDGDTYLDGAEVSAGYDPKGSGKLLEVGS